MIRRVLVANRGEIAVRIIRACREMNIETVAVYSRADREALFVTLSTRAVCIGGERAADSYLNINNIISAALAMECDAIHPGFGFLSENPDFVARVRESGLIFIGPAAEVIKKLGDKSAARELMRACGVPVVPGSDGIVKDVEQAMSIAEDIGYPVLVKASAGGGGRGMRRADNRESLKAAFEIASSEAFSCFADRSMYVEKLIVNPRHIEFQILADNMGNVVHLGERECSVQRRNQKMLEEAPSKALSEDLRRRMGEAAVKAAKSAGYTNAGTVEFILDSEDNFYFIEMNTRIQVEHPVTEMITGIDIVREQIHIADGMALKFTQGDICFSGHAIECRLNAEDPENDFVPCPGKIDYLHLPGGFGVRVDTYLYSGCEISPYYDSMMAKIIVHGKTRNEAILRMRRVLEETIATGVKNNLGLLYMIFYHPDFIRGKYDTGFIEKNLGTLLRHVGKDMVL